MLYAENAVFMRMLLNLHKNYNMKRFSIPPTKLMLLIGFAAAVSCKQADVRQEAEAALLADDAAAATIASDYSVTPPLVKIMPGFESLQVNSLVGSDDVLPLSPGFIFGGSADGAGLLRLGQSGFGDVADARYALLVNHEDNYAVSRLLLDRQLRPIKGEYILNSNGGTWRICSATMATPQEHGFGPTFLTCGENGPESRIHAVNPLETAFNPALSKEVPGLGRWSAENCVPLPKSAYPGKTVMLIGDDDFQGAGQFVLYMSDVVGDLNNGKVYVMRRADQNNRETSISFGNSYDVEFVEINDISTLTGAQITTESDAKNAIKFGRVEDIDYRKGSPAAGREVYYTVTGQAYSGVNADSSRTKYGRVYRLVLNRNNPLKGKLEVVLDGDVRPGIADQFQNPDNICVTENYVYVQEDPNSYGDETHDAYVYQYNIATKELKKVFELDHRRDAPDATKYNPTGPSSKG